jgi:hypothetical protein
LCAALHARRGAGQAAPVFRDRKTISKKSHKHKDGCHAVFVE